MKNNVYTRYAYNYQLRVNYSINGPFSIYLPKHINIQTTVLHPKGYKRDKFSLYLSFSHLSYKSHWVAKSHYTLIAPFRFPISEKRITFADKDSQPKTERKSDCPRQSYDNNATRKETKKKNKNTKKKRKK